MRRRPRNSLRRTGSPGRWQRLRSANRVPGCRRHRFMRFFSSLAAAALLAAALLAIRAPAQTARDPEKALVSARATLLPMTRRLTNYACIETVDRSYFRHTSGREDLALESTDRLRLDVTVSQGREIHSWPGATRFDLRAVDEMISGGPIGAGAFATHLLDIFDN